MKNCILTLLLTVPVITGLSQNMNANRSFVKQEELAKISTIQELIPIAYRYLTNWSNTIVYESVEIVATANGQPVSYENKGGQFTKEQKLLFSKVEAGSELTFNINYSHLPMVGEKTTQAKKTHTIDLHIAAIPAYEAQYPGGQQKLADYLTARMTEKLANPWTQVKLPEARVQFIVNEKGEATNIHLTKSTSNQTTDKYLIDALNKMEKWEPAQNSKGEKIKQEFNLILPLNNGGC